MRLRLLFKHSFTPRIVAIVILRLVFRLCRLMCGRSLTFREDPLVELGALRQSRGAAPVELAGMFRWGIAATAHQVAEPHAQGVKNMITSLQHKNRPLPLGEGWGEGLARTRTTAKFFFSFSLSFAPSPWP